MYTGLTDFFQQHLTTLTKGPRAGFADALPARYAGGGVYLVWEEGTPVFTKTTEDIRTEWTALRSDPTHPLRAALREHRLAELPAFRRRTPPQRELERLLADNFELTFVAVAVGELEVRERVIRQFRPRYNFRP